MRHFSRLRAVLLAAAVASSFFVAGCFNPDEPPCAFSCGPNGECPRDYSCLADNYCHLHGKATACGYGDAGVDLSSGDLHTPEDLLQSFDALPDQSLDQSIDQGTAPADLSSQDLQ